MAEMIDLSAVLLLVLVVWKSRECSCCRLPNKQAPGARDKERLFS